MMLSDAAPAVPAVLLQAAHSPTMTHAMTASLFDDPPQPAGPPEVLEPGAVVLRGFALAQADALVQGVQQVAAQAPWRHMLTPGGQAMSVAMTGCGPLSWVSDRRGYRYAERDPVSGRPWPAMPAAFMRLAQDAARQQQRPWRVRRLHLP